MVGDTPGVRCKVIKGASASHLALKKGKKERPRSYISVRETHW